MNNRIEITPVQTAFEQFCAAHRALALAPCASEESRLTDEVATLADRVVDIPAASPLDVLMKMAAQTLFGECTLDACPRGAEVLAEAVAMVQRGA